MAPDLDPARRRRRCGCCAGSASVDPESLDGYRAHGGYAALRRALELGPAGVIREVTESKLLGRGGAAFPTGRKWDAVARNPVGPHYLVCNADESEPGTFKDRVADGGRPVRGDRGDDDRRLRHRLRARLPLRARRVPAGAGTGWRTPITEPRAAAACSATTSWATACASTSSCAAARAPTSAARRRRSSTRSRATAASRATSRRSRSRSGSSASRRSSTTSRRWSTCSHIVSRGRRAPSPAIGTEQSTGHEALLPVRATSSGRASTRCRSASRCATLIEMAAASPAAGELRAVLLGGAAGAFVGPDKLDVAADLRGHPRRRRDARLGRGHGLRRHGRPGADPAADRRVLPRRVVRPVRALPRRHRAPGGAAAAAGERPPAGHRRRRAGAARRDRPGDARRVDLRPRPDGGERDRVGDARRCGPSPRRGSA